MLQAESLRFIEGETALKSHSVGLVGALTQEFFRV